MKEENFEITSTFDKLKIKGKLFIPANENEIKGLFFISHGMSEHKERYFEFMKYLTNEGYITIIHDHRGHGESLNAKEDLGYFKDTKGEAIVEDLKEVITYIKKTSKHRNNTIRTLYGIFSSKKIHTKI